MSNFSYYNINDLFGKEKLKCIIYKATNLINNKCYIGQTSVSLEGRKKSHLSQSRYGRESSVYFHNAIKKYGKDNFKWEIIFESEVFDRDEIHKKEIFYIAKYNSNNKIYGYNMTEGGDCGSQKFGEDNPWHSSNTTKEERHEHALRIAKIRKERGTYYTGDKHHWSKVNSSKEERLKRSMRGVAKRKELGIGEGSKSHMSKHWIITDPIGKTYDFIGGVHKWCKKHNFSIKILKNYMNKGTIKITKTVWNVISPNGTRYTIFNMSEFCKNKKFNRNTFLRQDGKGIIKLGANNHMNGWQINKTICSPLNGCNGWQVRVKENEISI